MSEVWHERGCDRIGSAGEFRVARVDGTWMLPCCDAPFAGHAEAVTSPRGLGDPCYLSERREPPTHVEHPKFAEADRQAEQDRLDGWVASIMAIGDARTRAAVSEALTNHMITYGRVP